MGDPNVRGVDDEGALRHFTEALLGDLRALERLLPTPLVERGVARLGAEQELFLVGPNGRPLPVAPAVLASADDPRLTPEIARFNLEANLTPRRLAGPSLSALHDELREVVAIARTAASREGADVVLAGILPTLEPRDLDPASFSPGPRYLALDEAVRAARGEDARIHIEGIDELELRTSSVLLEACNTSFQLHLQVDPESFARSYNLAQWIAAPLLAIGAGSPLLFDRRLWRETRIALFRQSVDARSAALRARGGRARVSFGDAWIRESILELFRDDVARHRPLVVNDAENDAEATVARGEVPSLRALRLHAGTVWRWNRGCYGTHVDDEGSPRAHLRIECRVLPSGPSLTDEVANAALFYGLMIGGAEAFGDPAATMPFEAARETFLAAARTGLQTELALPDGTRANAATLLRERLIPLAREGLREAGVDANDADHYLGVLDARVRERRTLSAWLLEGHRALADRRPAERSAKLTNALRVAQEADAPIHTWPACADVAVQTHAPGDESVRAIMSSDLFTLRPGDTLDLAATMMAWRHVRHVPVEDAEGHLLGLLELRTWLTAIARGTESPTVREVMRVDPPTITPDASAHDALRRLLETGASALPVVDEGRLVGLVTERDLLHHAARMLER
jgi:CBS domain-containing protein